MRGPIGRGVNGRRRIGLTTKWLLMRGLRWLRMIGLGVAWRRTILLRGIWLRTIRLGVARRRPVGLRGARLRVIRLGVIRLRTIWLRCRCLWTVRLRIVRLWPIGLRRARLRVIRLRVILCGTVVGSRVVVCDGGGRARGRRQVMNIWRSHRPDIGDSGDGASRCYLAWPSVIHGGKLGAIGAGGPLDLQLGLHGRSMRFAQGG